MNVDKIYKIQRNFIIAGVLFISAIMFLSVGVLFAEVSEVPLSEVLEWKYGNIADTCQQNRGDLSENPKMIICGWHSQQPQPSEAEIEVFTKEYLGSQDYWVKRFNPELAIAREAQVFDASEMIRLAPVSYTINALISYKNFTGGVANGVPYAGLKQLLEGLVSGGIILQSDADKLSGILAEQGISLND